MWIRFQTHIEKLLNFTFEEIFENENADENTEPCEITDDEVFRS